MKKVIVLFLIIVCMFAVSCGNKNTENVVSEDETVTESLVNEIETEEVATEESEMQNETEVVLPSEEINLPAASDPNGITYEELPDDIKGMIIPIDSLLLYNVEIGGEYTLDNPEMFWMTMYFAVGNFGESNNHAKLLESEWAVTSADIKEFASSFIPEFQNIPQIPDALSTLIRYDSAEDIYFFGVGDRGLSGTEILSYEYVDNNTLKIKARLFGLDDDMTINEGEFTLARNNYVQNVAEPLFYFTVTEAVFIKE